MSNVLIAILGAVSFATWIYTKQMRRSGNNTKNSLVLAGVIAVIVFFVILTVAITVDDMLK